MKRDPATIDLPLVMIDDTPLLLGPPPVPRLTRISPDDRLIGCMTRPLFRADISQDGRPIRPRPVE
jgi:hypothetical protein